jgi:hypothetical protein
MHPETSQLMADMEKELFESKQFKAPRDLICWTSPNTGIEEDIDTLLDRIDAFAPDMIKFVDSLQ